jgi:ribosomal protein L11 methyltransferase
VTSGRTTSIEAIDRIDVGGHPGFPVSIGSFSHDDPSASSRDVAPRCERNVRQVRWDVPYRVDLQNVGGEAFDRLVELGAIDADASSDGGVAALMPDSVEPEQIARALGLDRVSIAPAEGRDADSVWVLRPRPIQIGRLRIVPASQAEPGALQLVDGAAFGTGLHPTTALCLETIEDVCQSTLPKAVLDVGTGSGVLALGALMMGVPHALGIDLDEGALRVAAQNARINAMRERLQLARGGPDSVIGTWPLVVANVLAAPLIEMAPMLVRRVGRHGHLLLSGIPLSVERDVEAAYHHLGARRRATRSRAGWVALLLQASW